ncbi:AGPS_2 [Blepharisma stoltei]|uniref:Alkylglycerone-phosphate synthase n=1 Tax=Blepharisma stoltei TaxID=1481888 RepID=A0AAU9KAS8_9CILI|nr:unnamed protein product [Blepharisma stoltei]
MENSVRRLSLISNHLGQHIPKYTWFKPDGWGFTDTKFFLNKQNQVYLGGNRYLDSGKILPSFAQFFQDQGLEFANKSTIQKSIPVDPPVRNQDFLDRIKQFSFYVTEEDQDRAFHSHGHTLQEMFIVKFGKFDRTVDLVVYPETEEHVGNIVKLANELNVVLVPYGGGTNVTHALQLDPNEKRTICSVDLSKLSKVKEVNKESMTAVVEAGIAGKDLEKELLKHGVCCGHEPDSVEFSTLGGWISTNASGMKKNIYGNIDDIVLTIRIVTPLGTWEKPCNAPRMSTGPDVNRVLIGSEGLFGIITSATIKVKPLPAHKAYDSYVFPNFELGTKFMKFLGVNNIRPASVRLVDNMQFQFALSLKPAEHSIFKHFMDRVKKFYLLTIKGFDPKQICACTLVYEGNKEVVDLQQHQIDEVARNFKGLRGGPENGLRGYFLTYMIAYLRDFGMEYDLVAESFETAISWDKLDNLLKSLPKCIEAACAARGVKKRPFVSSRITQVYDTGACVYVYFGFFHTGVPDPVKVYCEVEDEAREEILRCGGSLSHHHGVGKLRKKFMNKCVGEPALSILRGVKKEVDPKNIFANGNLI